MLRSGGSELGTTGAPDQGTGDRGQGTGDRGQAVALGIRLPGNAGFQARMASGQPMASAQPESEVLVRIEVTDHGAPGGRALPEEDHGQDAGGTLAFLVSSCLCGKSKRGLNHQGTKTPRARVGGPRLFISFSISASP